MSDHVSIGTNLDELRDELGGGGSTPSGMLEPVKTATTGNIALAGLQTIDGVALQEGDRVLVWLQTDPTEVGVYGASAGAWTKLVSDADVADKLIYNSAGEYAGSQWGSLFVEAGYAYDGVPYFYPQPTAASGMWTPLDRTNLLGAGYKFYATGFWTANGVPGGGGMLWVPGGQAYGSQSSGGANAAWQITEDGAERLGGLATLGTSAPTDGSIQTGQKAKWYDDTTGKPVERFKEKDAAGTLSAGVSLASTGNQDTVGAAGGAAALPASPTHYIKVRDVNGDLYVIPAFAAS